MEHGDLAAISQDRYATVYEGLLIPEFKLTLRQRYDIATGHWSKFIDSVGWIPIATRSLSSLIRQYELSFDVYTVMLPQDGADYVADRLEMMGVQVSNVIPFASEDAMVEHAAISERVKRVFDSDKNRLERFRFKGFGVTRGQPFPRVF